MAKQSTLQGTDSDKGVRLQTSFGGMQLVATKEPTLRDAVYLVIGGHVSQVKEAGADDSEKLIVTITGEGQLISKDDYYKLLGTTPSEGTPEPTPEELEALEAELAEKEAGGDGE